MYYLPIIFSFLKINAEDYTGKYIHKFTHNNQIISKYYEFIELKNEGVFDYEISVPGHKYTLTGNWQIRNDSVLVLDSKTQRFPTLVTKRTHKKKTKRVKISVFSPSGAINGCAIYVVQNNDTTEYYHNYAPVKIKTPFDYFFLNDVIVQSHNINYDRNVKSYRIVFQQSLVFNDEHWVMCDGYIKSKDSSGKYKSYFLIKK